MCVLASVRGGVRYRSVVGYVVDHGGVATALGAAQMCSGSNKKRCQSSDCENVENRGRTRDREIEKKRKEIKNRRETSGGMKVFHEAIRDSLPFCPLSSTRLSDAPDSRSSILQRQTNAHLSLSTPYRLARNTAAPDNQLQSGRRCTN